MPDEFTPKTWADGSAGGTPVTAAELNRVEAGVESADDRLDAIEAGPSLDPTYATPSIREVVFGSGPDSDTDGFTLTTSSAVQAGDTMLLIHGNDWNFETNMLAPGGDVGAWEMVENAAGAVNLAHIKAWRATVATSGVRTVEVEQASIGSDDYYGTLIVFVGSVVCELSDTARSDTASTSHVAPSLTSDGAGRRLVCAWQTNWANTGDQSYSTAAGMTVLSNAHVGATTSGAGSLQVATEAISAAGATGTRTATYSDSRAWAAMSLLVTQRADPIADALDAVPSLEELQSSLALGTISATTTFSLTSAMFDMRVPAFAIAAAAITASDTDYWTVQLTRYRVGVPTTIASRTTRATAPGGAVVSGQAWTFDLVAFDPNACLLRKDDVLGITFTPTGSPTAWTAAVGTWRYEPGIPA